MFIHLVCEHPSISVQHTQLPVITRPPTVKNNDIFFLFTGYVSNFLGKLVLYHTPVTPRLLEIFISLNPTLIFSTGKGIPRSIFSCAVEVVHEN